MVDFNTEIPRENDDQYNLNYHEYDNESHILGAQALSLAAEETKHRCGKGLTVPAFVNSNRIPFPIYPIIYTKYSSVNWRVYLNEDGIEVT
ncbi:hypothetical protein [Photobacterium leiognathi]|uniref:hypothetical protein n=1 Tax=Photobacterium leiognathi TaxID=553611 RepID=UPI002980DEA5|nr:hypothetical protein [Photobacterium leiognathi]